MSSSIFAYKRDCATFQRRRQAKLDELAPTFDVPLTEVESKIHALTLPELVEQHRAGSISSEDVVYTYGKKAFAAQKAVNCLSDVMLQDYLPPKGHIALDSSTDPRQHDAHATSSVSSSETFNDDLDQPLSGVPISIKDVIDVEGHPTTLGYSVNALASATSSAPLVHLLRRAGAILHVKTSVPMGLFSLETDSELFGRTANPHNHDFSAGASTGGGAALLASGGSMIEIGSDVGGSVRLPSAFCGVYGMKASNGRFPATGAHASTPGCESVPTVVSPMARRLEDLEEFWKRVMSLRPWEVDRTCIPMPWRPVSFEGKKLRVGVLWSDGIIPLSPAARRAINITIEALKARGHEVVDFRPPTFEVLKTGYQLGFAEGGAQVAAPLRPFERLNGGIAAVISTYRLPYFIKHILASFLPPRDAALLRAFHPKSVFDMRSLVVEQDSLKQQWHEMWMEQGLDIVICPPCSVPALPAGGTSKAGLASASYTFMFNILDLPAGVIPVTTVSSELDYLPSSFKLSDLGPSAQGAYSLYDAEKMHGLPVGVQVVGRRLMEETVLAGMREVHDAVAAWRGQSVRAEWTASLD